VSLTSNAGRNLWREIQPDVLPRIYVLNEYMAVGNRIAVGFVALTEALNDKRLNVADQRL
jgi:hypothetical protein